jgi:hypothetical protein
LAVALLQDEDDEEEPVMTLVGAMACLTAITVTVAVCSECVVGLWGIGQRPVATWAPARSAHMRTSRRQLVGSCPPPPLPPS